MKTENKAIKVRGVKTPNYNEPKGNAYYKLLNKLRVEYIQARSEVSQARSEIEKAETEISNIQREIDSTSEDNEKFSLRKQISVLRKKIEPLEEKAYQNVEKMRINVLNNEELSKARDAAIEEHKEVNQDIRDYEQELDRAYKATKQDIMRFTADYKSDSKFRKAETLLNRLKD